MSGRSIIQEIPTETWINISELVFDAGYPCGLCEDPPVLCGDPTVLTLRGSSALLRTCVDSVARTHLVRLLDKRLRCEFPSISANIMLGSFHGAIPWFQGLRFLQLVKQCCQLQGSCLAGSTALFVELLQCAKSPGDPPSGWAPTDLDLWVDDPSKFEQTVDRVGRHLKYDLQRYAELRIPGRSRDVVFHGNFSRAFDAPECNIRNRGSHGLEVHDSEDGPLNWETTNWHGVYLQGLRRCEISSGPWTIDVISFEQCHGENTECICDACVPCLFGSRWPRESPHHLFDLDIVSLKLELGADGVLRTRRSTAAPAPREIQLRPRAVSWLTVPDTRDRLIARLKKYSLRGYRRVIVPLQASELDLDGELTIVPTDPFAIQELRDALNGHVEVITRN